MSDLFPCPGCQRHVRRSETRCPFCEEPVSLGHLPSHRVPRRRLGRAATFAFGASVVGATAVVACGDDGNVAPPYGVAPIAGSASDAGRSGAPSGGTSGTGGTVGDVGGTVAGGPPSGGTGGVAGTAGRAGDGATGGDAGAAGRAGDDATGGGGDGGLTTIYGGPPAGAGGE